MRRCRFQNRLARGRNEFQFLLFRIIGGKTESSLTFFFSASGSAALHELMQLQAKRAVEAEAIKLNRAFSFGGCSSAVCV